MDFIEGLPPLGGKTKIFVVVDRLSKYSHFMPITHPYIALIVARVFMDNVFKLHGLPLTIVSDQDPVFTSNFWREMFRLCGTYLLLSTAYHPQMDGQTESMNKVLECYLGCFSSDRPKDWAKWLPLPEYFYNTSVHTSTKVSPFEAVYGQPRPQMLPYESGATKVQAVDEELRSREFIANLIKENLQEAQAKMKYFADKKKGSQEFEIDDFVYLRLRPYQQMIVSMLRNLKIASRFYRPFKVVRKVGQVAYELDLPPKAKIYPIFHV